MTSPENPRSNLERLHAVLVEDSADDAELMVHQLRQSGFELT